MADLSPNVQAVAASSESFQSREYLAGVEITQGEFLYLDDNTRWQKLSANAGATGNEVDRLRGVSLNHAYPNQPLAVAESDTGFTPGSTLTKGQTYVASGNAGKIAPVTDLTSGWYRTVVGVAISTALLNLTPSASGNTA